MCFDVLWRASGYTGSTGCYRSLISSTRTASPLSGIRALRDGPEGSCAYFLFGSPVLQDVVCWLVVVDSLENGRIWENWPLPPSWASPGRYFRVFKFMNAKASSTIVMTNPFLHHFLWPIGSETNILCSCEFHPRHGLDGDALGPGMSLGSLPSMMCLSCDVIHMIHLGCDYWAFWWMSVEMNWIRA